MVKRVESPSSINTFQQCKRKYYYQYIEKLPTFPSIHTVRGNIAHSCLEDFYEIDISTFTKEDTDFKFRAAMQKLLLHHWVQYKPKLVELNLNKDQERFYFEETMLMLMNWTNQFLDILKKEMAKGKTMQEAFYYLTPIREQEYRSESNSVRGFVDAIHHYGDEVHIVDYKTNANSEVKDSIMLQLGIYSLLYKEKHGTPPHKVGIYFLRDRLKLMPVNEELMNKALQTIEGIHAHTSITESKIDYPKTITPLCKWSSGQCDFYGVCKPHDRDF